MELNLSIAEFMLLTGLTNKTARWLHDNVLHPEVGSTGKHRKFSRKDVDWVYAHQIQNFELVNPGVRIKEIPGSTCYITDTGIVYNNARGFLEVQQPNINFGYVIVGITIYGRRLNYRVHRLVAEAFIPNPENKPQINHKDGVKTNNHYTNLEWSTASENTKHAFDNGLVVNDTGYADSQSKQVIAINAYSNYFEREYGSLGELSRESGMSKGKLSKMIKRHNIYEPLGVYFVYTDSVPFKSND